ncbi:hypothetical protein AMTR_s00060p00122460 [Amborella trichopoda]|uniref:Uncharacterized protein n=1 Tax=Amborella trichopoda TaxID=13333 RepID=W1NKX1_AMBTC|nr:hypothetical protein AMTR_s00060p00122460 [Amborella trichopoda]
MSSPNFPRQLSISLNPDLTIAILRSRDHTIDIPLAEDFEEGAHEASLEAEGDEDPDIKEVTRLRESMKKLCREVDYHQHMFQYYKGEADHAKETLALVK